MTSRQTSTIFSSFFTLFSSFPFSIEHLHKNSQHFLHLQLILSLSLSISPFISLFLALFTSLNIYQRHFQTLTNAFSSKALKKFGLSSSSSALRLQLIQSFNLKIVQPERTKTSQKLDVIDKSRKQSMNYFCFEASRQEKLAKNNLKLFGTFLTSQSYNHMMFNSLIFKSLIMMAFFTSKSITIIFF